jgi:CubicO group peptidase (beta-lactamase class C family)
LLPPFAKGRAGVGFWREWRTAVSSEETVVDAASLGFDAERLKRLPELVQHGITEGMFPAAVYRVLRRGRIVAQGALGMAQPDANPPVAATLATVFDMASISKPFAATLLLKCVERGDLHLGQPIGDFLPEAGDSPVGKVSLRQIATHVSGLPPWRPLYQGTDSALTQIFATPLEHEPGTHYAYSDLGYILLGEIVARVGGEPLNVLAQKQIFTPLGMTRTTYCPPREWHPQIAATANCGWRKDQVLVGEVHDANAHSMGGVSGHAGLFSNVLDLTRFALAFQYPEEAAAQGIPPLLGRLARRLAQERQIAPEIGGHSIGWFTPPNGMLPCADLLSPRTFGHTGFTGTLLMFDPEHELTLMLLTNHVYTTRTGLLTLRRQLANAVAGALTGS